MAPISRAKDALNLAKSPALSETAQIHVLMDLGTFGNTLRCAPLSRSPLIAGVVYCALTSKTPTCKGGVRLSGQISGLHVAN
jgi:hypothetical protein